jgi:hypothetical protein
LSFEATKSFSGFQLLSCCEIYVFASESLQRAENTSYSARFAKIATLAQKEGRGAEAGLPPKCKLNKPSPIEFGGNFPEDIKYNKVIERDSKSGKRKRLII